TRTEGRLCDGNTQFLSGLLGFDSLQIWARRKRLSFLVSERRNRKCPLGKRVRWLIWSVGGHAHRGIELGARQREIVPGTNQFFIAACQSHLSAEQIRLHYQASIKPHLAALHDGLRSLLRLFGHVQLLTSKQHPVIRLHDSEQDLLISAFQLLC